MGMRAAGSWPIARYNSCSRMFSIMTSAHAVTVKPLCVIVIAAALRVATADAIAQNFPDKTVTMIAPFPAGGSVDLVARAVAQRISELWKQPVVVVNRP